MCSSCFILHKLHYCRCTAWRQAGEKLPNRHFCAAGRSAGAAEMADGSAVATADAGSADARE